MNAWLIVAFAIFYTVPYTWAGCKVKLSVVAENDKLPVTNSYLQSRDSPWERFKNMMKGRLVDPICTAKQDVGDAICECAGGNKSKKGKQENKGDTKESCSWIVLSKPDGISLLKYANLYPCGDAVYITQGYAHYGGNVHDVFVVAEKKNDQDIPYFVFKKILKAINFDEFKEENHSYWNQLYLQGLSFVLNWDKHLS